MSLDFFADQRFIISPTPGLASLEELVKNREYRQNHGD